MKAANIRHDILALGNLLVDRTMLISDYPKETMLATISDIEWHCGGGCTNILFNLAKLDPTLPLYLSGAVGQDSEGQFILRQAQKQHINVEAVSEFPLPTSFTDVMINRQNGDRTFFHYLGAMSLYGLNSILHINNPAKIVHIAYLPLLPALLNLDTLKQLFNWLHNQGFKISIDLVSVNDKRIFSEYILPTLSYIDYVIINDVEAKILTDNENCTSTKENLLLMAQSLLQQGIKKTIVIHCPSWAVACNQQHETQAIPSYWVEKQNIVSTLGAGDAFCAGILYGLHQEMSLQETLKLGHCLAYFNLFSLSATDGAVSYQTALAFQSQMSQEQQN